MVNTPLKILFIIPVWLCLTGFSFSQNETISKAIEFINQEKYNEGLRTLTQIDTTQLDIENRALSSFYIGYSNSQIDKHDVAYRFLLDAKILYKKLGFASDVKDCNIELLKTLSHQNNLNISQQSLIDELEEYAKKSDDPDLYYTIFRQLGGVYLDDDNFEDALDVFRQSMKLSTQKKDSIQIAYDLMNIATVFQTGYKLYDSALIYNKESLDILKKNNDSLVMSYNYNNQAQTYKAKKNYKQALKYYLLADSINLKSNKNKSKVIFYENIIDLFAISEDFKSAYLYSKKLEELQDSIADDEQNIAIQDYRTKYQTAEKEKENLILTAQKKRNQNIAIGLGGSLALGSIIAVLIYRNTKRKQRIAEQEKEIEIQRTEKVLKEKEIETINAMVEGQEKERQRLAGELHDNLGSTLVTVRMQVENLERNLDQVEDPKELLSKTNELINQAYEKVRHISHERNAGVLAKDGLLPALERLARTISSSNGLHLQVQEFGLDQRLSNDMEIAIFRIVQELVTNIVKHAKASEATISLTQHDKELNIMVEDNGKGFKAGKLIEKDGMGLGSIERRVEHLEGTMEVDSSIGKGTNVIIDIPL